MGEVASEYNGRTVAEGRSFLARLASLPLFPAAVRDRLEAERARWFLWLPVSLGAGVVAYFDQATEPDVVMVLALPVMALGLWAAVRRNGSAAIVTSVLLAAALGFAVTKLRTEWVRAPVLERRMFAEVAGRVELVEPRPGRGQRITIRVSSIGGLEADKLPKRVRIRAMKARAGLAPGDIIRIKATLSPPAGPALPGGYDFARMAWYLGIGATGYALGAPTVEPASRDQSVAGALSAALERLRQGIGARITAALPGEPGAIATSLITGERGGITDATNQAFRDSGLLHILSISGLHMVVMAGAVFLLIRLAFAAVPGIALRYATKKWAAAAALVAALGYLLLSGSSVATVRAFLMIAVMFLAVMADRPALAMRNVALSAFLILIVMPESLLDAGFQMSYAAVVALISAYEALRERGNERVAHGPVVRLLLFFGGIVLTTVIASLAVAPFAAFHFHRSQQYALLANMIAIPICNVIVMPAALLVLILMPFGLERWPLLIMEQGDQAMVLTAQTVGGLPGAVLPLPAMSTMAFGLMVVGGLWLTLWKTRWRMAGLAAIGAGVALAADVERPDVLAGVDGALVAVRSADGHLAALASKRATFELSRWLEHDGDSRDPKQVLKVLDGFRCDGAGCTVRTPQGALIAISRHAAAFADDCAEAELVISNARAPQGCNASAIVLDYPRFRQDGGYAIYFSHDAPPGAARASSRPAFRVETVAAARGDRPWSPYRVERTRVSRASGAAGDGRVSTGARVTGPGLSDPRSEKSGEVPSAATPLSDTDATPDDSFSDPDVDQ